MSTRAAVIVKLANGKYQGIYNHSDGYGLLPHLQTIAPTQAQAEQLVALGSCSMIYGCTRIAPIGKHNFNEMEDGTVIAYHRDRQESWDHCKPITAAKWLTVAKKIDHTGYAYVFENGQWSMYQSGGYGENKFALVQPEVEVTV